jgi:hypothetical protein
MQRLFSAVDQIFKGFTAHSAQRHESIPVLKAMVREPSHNPGVIAPCLHLWRCTILEKHNSEVIKLTALEQQLLRKNSEAITLEQ